MIGHVEVVEKMSVFFTNFATKLIAGLITLFIGFLASHLINKALQKGMAKAHIDEGVLSFVHSVSKTVLNTLVILCAISQLGINLTSIIAAIGAAGVTVGFALKDSLANLASGALILMNKPFRVGDCLETEGLQGTVEKIEMMFTTLTTYDNKKIVLPNAKLTQNSLINYSAKKTRRLDLTYEIGYDDNIEQAKELLKELLSKNPLVLSEPAPAIVVGEHRENGIAIVSKVWCNAEDISSVYHQMQESVKLTFDQHGITIPYRQIDIRLKSEQAPHNKEAFH